MPRLNNFALIRLLAALQLYVMHAVAWLSRAEHTKMSLTTSPPPPKWPHFQGLEARFRAQSESWLLPRLGQATSTSTNTSNGDFVLANR